ncbi:hypothetical protein ACGFRB_30680, partial [Streptomyces sp. NPDC048718]|uniref:hypothetical protein n=1 Tax=Streptomyces sp. NPDC048718 TaxID=3365587 RepID=UPI00371CDCE3
MKAEKDWKAESESEPKGSDKLETPEGNGSESDRDRKAPRKSDRKDLIESETKEAPGGKPERV